MSRNTAADPRRGLPSVDRLLSEPDVQRLEKVYGRELLVVQVRRELDARRSEVAAAAGGVGPEEARQWVRELPDRLARGIEERLGAPLTRVLNATGILLHTNLGRAPLPRPVAAALPTLLDAYCDLEIDLGTGRRGERNRRAGELLRQLTGAGAGLVVNNNAGALVLILGTLARDHEVVVSRGELVEIGGSFRVPEIMAAAGARLVEVGTTNRTRPGDYAAAIGPETALLLKVHPSNYTMSGFVEEASPSELARVGREAGVPLVMDEGSGLLRPHPAPQLAGHPSFRELLEAGCDLVCGSGDKLLGGPQAGLIAGRADLVDRCRRSPLYRALRPDRAVFGSLEAVLRRHLTGAELPLDRLWPDPAAHDERLRRVGRRVGARIVPADAYLGGGAAPEQPIPGRALALPGSTSLLERLRRGAPPVVGYLKGGRLLLDLRTVDPADDDALVDAVARAAAS